MLMWYDEAFKIRHESHIPLYKIDEKKGLHLNGTGTLIRQNGKFYIITAKHVLDKREDLGNYLDKNINYILNGTVITVPESDIRIVGKESDQSDVDIAIIRIDLTTAEAIGIGHFVRGKAICPNFKYKPDALIGATGFPGTRSKIDSQERTALAQSKTYIGYLAAADIKRTNPLPRKDDVVIHFDISNCYHEGRENVPAVKPNGISGGGMWAAPSFRLIAISTNYSKADKLMIGTDISVVIREIDIWQNEEQIK